MEMFFIAGFVAWLFAIISATPSLPKNEKTFYQGTTIDAPMADQVSHTKAA